MSSVDIPTPQDLHLAYLESAEIDKIIKRIVAQVKSANEKGQTQIFVEHGDRRILEAVAKAFEDKGYEARIKPGDDIGDLPTLTLCWTAKSKPNQRIAPYENEHEK